MLLVNYDCWFTWKRGCTFKLIKHIKEKFTYRLSIKSIPLQARRGAQRSRKLRFPDSVTTAQDGGRLSAVKSICSCIPDSHPHRITSTKCRINTVVSPDDGHMVARNM